MAYNVKQTKTIDRSADQVIKSVSETLTTLAGKVSKKNKPDQGYFSMNFNKKIMSEYMNNRVQLEIKIKAGSADQCTLSAEAYPVDPVGQKLMFGVRGKPARLVMERFLTELAAQLAK